MPREYVCVFPRLSLCHAGCVAAAAAAVAVRVAAALAGAIPATTTSALAAFVLISISSCIGITHLVPAEGCLSLMCPLRGRVDLLPEHALETLCDHGWRASFNNTLDLLVEADTAQLGTCLGSGRAGQRRQGLQDVLRNRERNQN